MLKFTRSFEDVVIRMIKMEYGDLYFSAYDIASALSIREKRKAINEAVIKEDNQPHSFIWEGEKIIFIDESYFPNLINHSEWSKTKKFIKWVDEVVSVANGMTYFNDLVDDRNYFATTQIAKKYGLSAKALNEILKQHEIQYKVNDQWVLYSKYQTMDLMTTKEISKENNGLTYHSYWTVKGATFVENLLERLGYKEEGKQLDMFSRTD